MIPGLTDRKRLPRLGKIRLGEKRENANGKEYAAALDYFNFRDVPEVAEIYGEECREIYPVLLPSDDEEVWFPTARKAYLRSGLFCACSDGTTAIRRLLPRDSQGLEFLAQTMKRGAIKAKKDGDSDLIAFKHETTGEVIREGEMFEIPCAGDNCPYFRSVDCKNNGRLFMLLPKVPRFGVYEITTSSANGMIDVLNYARSVQKTAGTLAGIPFHLTIVPKEATVEGRKKTIHHIKIEYRDLLEKLNQQAERLKAGGMLALLPRGASVDLQDAEIESDEELGGPVPDDLYAHGGAKLEAELTGAAHPKSEEEQAIEERLNAAPPVRKVADAPVTVSSQGDPPKRKPKLAPDVVQETVRKANEIEKAERAKQPPTSNVIHLPERTPDPKPPAGNGGGKSSPGRKVLKVL